MSISTSEVEPRCTRIICQRKHWILLWIRGVPRDSQTITDGQIEHGAFTYRYRHFYLANCRYTGTTARDSNRQARWYATVSVRVILAPSTLPVVEISPDNVRLYYNNSRQSSVTVSFCHPLFSPLSVKPGHFYKLRPKTKCTKSNVRVPICIYMCTYVPGMHSAPVYRYPHTHEYRITSLYVRYIHVRYGRDL